MNSPTTQNRTLVGSGKLRYAADTNWCRLPAGEELGEVIGVATDSRDRVYLFTRTPNLLRVFDREGTFLHTWTEATFVRPHGICIGPDDTLYLTDDEGHSVRRFTPDGRLLLTLGASGHPSDTGATSPDYRTIRRAAGPFNYPTNVALSPEGDIYVSDGYGNARIHRFTSDGRLLASWGEPGDSPGQFHVPHGIAIDRQGVVLVADRENSRIQRFTPDGEFIDQWIDVARPCDMFIDRAGRIFVAEIGFRAGKYYGTVPPNASGGRVSVFSPEGELLARWGGGVNPCAPGDFWSPHDVWIDSRGDLYVGEVNYTTGIRPGLVGTDSHTLQKFTLASE
ncbi:MAG TPA: peptidyl-alpha-hydroxyglycine alpha-amidating lyase family protein [Pirellulales bacterium]|jgi:DNA-binding beta-propeller fold protein YncE|nr:peptidyl-alpha-hydroxyglycine alpha-amidating lyase family protein [Pirellulales bacterium]